MSYKRHRIFASGVHNNDKDPVWPPEKVQGVFDATKAHSPAQIPYTYRHPENSLPVLGYANRDSVEVFEEGGRTFITAQPADLAKEWIASLKKTGFDKVSVGLGRFNEIVHIGITDRPAVSGLGLAFEAKETVPPVFTREFEFDSEDLGGTESLFEVSWKWHLEQWMANVAALFQQMRDKEIEANGIDSADNFLPAYVMDFIKTPLPKDLPIDQGEPMNPQFESDMSVDEKAELERLRAENAELLNAKAIASREKVDAEILGFCAEHPAVITPKIKDVIVAVLKDLYGAQPRQFEVDGRSFETTSYDAMKELLAGAKPQLVFEEVATHAQAEPAGGKTGADPVLQELKAQIDAAKRG